MVSEESRKKLTITVVVALSLRYARWEGKYPVFNILIHLNILSKEDISRWGEGKKISSLSGSGNLCLISTSLSLAHLVLWVVF